MFNCNRAAQTLSADPSGLSAHHCTAGLPPRLGSALGVVSTVRPPRDVAQYGDRINAGPSNQADRMEPYKVVFVGGTKATTC